MNNNILLIIQPSVIDYQKSLFTFRDSGVQMFLQLLRILHTKYNFITILPYKNDYQGIFEQYSIVRYVDLPLDAFKVRINFPVDQLPKQKYRYIICNIPEIVPEIKRIFYDTPIIMNNFFIDTPSNPKTKGSSLFYLQVNGALASDILLFTSEIIKNSFLEDIKNVSFKHYESLYNKPYYITPMGFSKIEIDLFPEARFHFKYSYDNSKKIIFFPNRITDPDYTNFEAFKNSILEIERDYPDVRFNLFIANPSNKKYSKEDFLSMFRNYVPTDSLTREEYLYLLKKSHMTISLFIKELFGGCSNLEAIYSGSYAIMPKINCYANRADSNYPFFVNPDLSNLKEKILLCLNTEKDASIIEKNKSLAIKESIEYSSEVYNRILSS